MVDDDASHAAPIAADEAKVRPDSTDLYRQFLEDLTEWVGRFQPDGTILYVNDAYCRFFGKTASELVGSRWQPIAVPEDVPQIEAQLRTLSPANPVVTIENRVISARGTVHWAQFVNRAFFNGQCQLVTLQAVGRDITERKDRELLLQQLTEEQAAILDNPVLGIFKVSHRVTVWANHAFAAMLGYTVEEVIGQPSRVRYVSEADYQQFARDALPVLAQGKPFSTQLQQRSKNGAIGWYEFTVRMLDAPSATLIGTMLDITQRKQAESALLLHQQTLEATVARRTAELIEARDAADSARVVAEQAQAGANQSLARLQAALSAMGDAVCIADDNGRFVERNAPFARFHRFASLAECPAVVQDCPAILEVFAPNGALLGPEDWAVLRALRGETAVNAEFTLRRRDTGDTWIGSYNYAPVRDAEGKVIGAVVTARDITAQKDIECRLQQAHDAARAGLRARDGFLSTINHELRTPMNAIMGIGQLLRRQTSEPRQVRQLDILLDASGRLLSLIENLVDLARIRSGALQLDDAPFELGGVLMQALALGRSRLGTRPLTLNLSLDDALQALRLRGDAGLLQEVLLHLIDNAIKFSEAGSIQLRCQSVSENTQQVHLRFEVQDPGCGIAVADQARIFLIEQVDASLTRRHGGAGLGLATCKALVEHMGGAIGVISAPGQGSIFWCTIPFQRAATAS